MATKLDPVVTVKRDSLIGMVRSLSNAANRAAAEAKGDRDAITMYATLARDGLTLCGRIEVGSIADVSISGAVETYVQNARRAGL